MQLEFDMGDEPDALPCKPVARSAAAEPFVPLGAYVEAVLMRLPDNRLPHIRVLRAASREGTGDPL